ncbi:Transcription factor Adf-1 [Orchesella cincta]|uniref:Transcription factor Adf-1 n=1 Tax=Orchesella cincta TaxID=48709 RepID=A0A1D2M1T8_ORCCI|nr:Transcription factor Adf-1 [Orchesella cincta]
MDDSASDENFNTVEYALINLVRLYPVLYNPNTLGHRDKNIKDSAWSEIARQLSKDDGWCYNKWQNLRDYYKKRKKIYESGNGCMAKRWIYFDAMQFLDPYEHSNRDNGSSNIGLINLSELSSGSSRSNDAVPEHVIITEPTDNRDHYFDETQYHSLDGIAERAEVKISHFLEPPSENYPPSKKQRVASTNAGGSNTILTSTPITAAASSSTAHTSRHCSHHHHHHGSATAEVVTPSIVSVQSKAESQSQNRNSEKQQSSCKPKSRIQ